MDVAVCGPEKPPKILVAMNGVTKVPYTKIPLAIKPKESHSNIMGNINTLVANFCNLAFVELVGISLKHFSQHPSGILTVFSFS